jgi:hypothetical protein
MTGSARCPAKRAASNPATAPAFKAITIRLGVEVEVRVMAFTFI